MTASAARRVRAEMVVRAAVILAACCAMWGLALGIWLVNKPRADIGSEPLAFRNGRR